MSTVNNSEFVTREGTRFTAGHRRFFVVGANSYYQMTYRRWKAGGPDEVLDKMQARGLNVVRTWAFQDASENGASLLAAPARKLEPHERPIDFLDPETFVALDETLAAADARGIRVLLTLVNNWQDYGGIDRWTLWRFGMVQHDAFFTDSTIRSWYQDLAGALIARVNTVNGRTYRDDPTIFAWELANEPRTSAAMTDGVDAWTREMSEHIKELDPNHMVTTGIEGFYGPDHPEGNTDGWMSACGTDFIRNHQHASIDFATCHIWPQNWGWDPTRDTAGALRKVRHYLEQRLRDARDMLGKPLLCEEFGIPRDTLGRGLGSGRTSLRDLFFQRVHEQIHSESGGAGAGWLAWHLLHDGYSQYDDGNGIFLPSDADTDAFLSRAASGLKS